MFVQIWDSIAFDPFPHAKKTHVWQNRKREALNPSKNSVLSHFSASAGSSSPAASAWIVSGFEQTWTQVTKHFMGENGLEWDRSSPKNLTFARFLTIKNGET
jgi:hypothetical protein